MSAATPVEPNCDPAIVVGGAGAVGSMLVEFLRRGGRSVKIVDPADAHGDFAVDITDSTQALRAALSEAALIVLAVPEKAALAVLPTLARITRDDALVVDTLSVKSRMSAAVVASGRAGEFLGLNPMFRPELGPRDRPVIAVPYIDGPRCRTFLGEIRSWGASVSVMDPDRHDRLAAATQSLTHAAVLAFGLALVELDVDPDEAIEVGPPPYRTLSALLARIVGGEPEVYWDVQSGNPYAASARKALSSACVRLEREIGDPDEFSDLVGSAAGGLGNRSDELNALCRMLFERVGASTRE